MTVNFSRPSDHQATVQKLVEERDAAEEKAFGQHKLVGESHTEIEKLTKERDELVESLQGESNDNFTRADELEKERASLHGELATMLGPRTPREGVTANDYWIAKVGGVLMQRDVALEASERATEKLEDAEASLARIQDGLRGEVERLRTGPWAVKPSEQVDRLQALIDSEPEREIDQPNADGVTPLDEAVVEDQLEHLKFGPRSYTPEQAEAIKAATADRRPLSVQPLPFDSGPPTEKQGGEDCERFKRLRDALLGEPARRVLVSRMEKYGWLGEVHDSGEEARRLADVRRALARVWDLATGHGPFALPADSNPDQGGGDRAAAESGRPTSESADATRAAVEVGGGLDTSDDWPWPPELWIGGDIDRPWMIWWPTERDDLICRRYVPAPHHPALEGLVEELESRARLCRRALEGPGPGPLTEGTAYAYEQSAQLVRDYLSGGGR